MENLRSEYINEQLRGAQAQAEFDSLYARAMEIQRTLQRQADAMPQPRNQYQRMADDQAEVLMFMLKSHSQ